MSQIEQEQLIGQGTADLTRRIAESKLGVTIPESTMVSWISLSRAIRVADDFIDSEQSDEVREGVYARAVGYLSGESEELGISNERLVVEMGDLRSHLGSISDEQRAVFIRNLRILLRISEKIKRTEKPADLAKLTMLEGQVTARLFISFLPKGFPEIAGYDAYVSYFTRLLRGINAFDSLVDFSADYNEGKIKVRPTLGNRAAFAANTLGNSVFIATHTSPSLVRSFGSGAKIVVGDRTGNGPIHFVKD